MKIFAWLAVWSLVAVPALAFPVDRGIVESGTDATVDSGAVAAGVIINRNNGPTRLRPATCVAGVCTRVAPTLAAEGLDLERVVSWALVVCAPEGETLLGAGKAELWRREPALALWAPMRDKHLNVSETANRCQAFAVVANDMAGRGHRILYRLNGVTVSGDGEPIVSLQACYSGGAFPTLPGCAP